MGKFTVKYENITVTDVEADDFNDAILEVLRLFEELHCTELPLHEFRTEQTK